MESSDILGFLREYIGRIMIILGAFFILIAVLLMSPVYQWNFPISLLLGVALIMIGSVLHFESLKWKVPSLQGVGTILIYVAPLFIATATVTIVFAVPEKIARIPIYGGQDEHGSPFAYVIPGDAQASARLVVLLLRRPYAWLAAPLILTGLGLLAFGFLLKRASDTF